MEWTEERKRKAQKTREETCLRKYGVKNIQHLKWVVDKCSKTNEERYGGVGFASRELSKKSRDTMEVMYGERNIMKTEKGRKHFVGKNNPLKNPDVRKKVSEKLKGRPSKLKGRTYGEIHGPEKAKQLIKERRTDGLKGYLLTPKISAPQLELFNLVKSIFPTAILEYPICGYCLDIAVLNKKLAFEYDGSYWHDPEKDKKRDEVLDGLGWKTIRFIDRLPTRDEIKLRCKLL